MASLQPAEAAQSFLGQRLYVYSAPGVIDETFILDITTEDLPTTVTSAGYTNPGVITPGGGTPDPGNPLLTSEPYKFTGFQIISMTGKRYNAGGTYNGDVVFDPANGTNAETVGVFNYPFGNPASAPIDLISHAIPDNLWNPGKLGLGFDAGSSPSIPALALDNFVSVGGLAFDVFDVGTTTLDEPYQLFTISKAPAAGLFTTLTPGDYAGCPGSCVGAKVNVPGPLPILGLAAAFGSSRKLRQRSAIQRRKATPTSISKG